MANSFDTLEATKAFKAAGFEEKQAEVMVQQINGAIVGTVATKADIERLEASTKAKIDLVKNDLTHLKTYVDTKLEALETHIDTKFEVLEAKFKAAQDRMWKIAAGAVGVIVVLNKALDYLFPGIEPSASAAPISALRARDLRIRIGPIPACVRPLH